MIFCKITANSEPPDLGSLLGFFSHPDSQQQHWMTTPCNFALPLFPRAPHFWFSLFIPAFSSFSDWSARGTNPSHIPYTSCFLSLQHLRASSLLQLEAQSESPFSNAAELQIPGLSLPTRLLSLEAGNLSGTLNMTSSKWNFFTCSSIMV